MRSVSDIALNPSLRKINLDTVLNVLLYRINSSCKLFLLMYTFIRLSDNALTCID